MPNDSPNNSLLPTITTMINNILNEGNGTDTLISVLSLLSLILIMNRTQPSMGTPQSQVISSTPSVATNPLQQILGQLSKSGDASSGGPSPDMLMSLLPLLNNPQVKSKLNPANISSILGMLGNFSSGGNNEKSDTPKVEKPETSKTEKPDITKTDMPQKKEPSTTTVPLSPAEHPTQINMTQSNEQDSNDLGRSLNWKSNFQHEKEV